MEEKTLCPLRAAWWGDEFMEPYRNGQNTRNNIKIYFTICIKFKIKKGPGGEEAPEARGLLGGEAAEVAEAVDCWVVGNMEGDSTWD